MASRLPTSRFSRGWMPPMKLYPGMPDGEFCRTSAATDCSAGPQSELFHAEQFAPYSPVIGSGSAGTGTGLVLVAALAVLALGETPGIRGAFGLVPGLAALGVVPKLVEAVAVPRPAGRPRISEAGAYV